jgi:hypothetical protein
LTHRLAVGTPCGGECKTGADFDDCREAFLTSLDSQKSRIGSVLWLESFSKEPKKLAPLLCRECTYHFHIEALLSLNTTDMRKRVLNNLEHLLLRLTGNSEEMQHPYKLEPLSL